MTLRDWEAKNSPFWYHSDWVWVTPTNTQTPMVTEALESENLVGREGTSSET